MPLLYVIDGYNIMNHARFITLHKKSKGSPEVLLEFIKAHKLCGSAKNNAAVVFDGWPNLSRQELEGWDIDVIFSKGQTADARIKKIIETRGNPRNMVVVSDDKEIKFFAKFSGARPMGVEEFIYRGDKPQAKLDTLKPELTFSQMERINQELRARWLK